MRPAKKGEISLQFSGNRFGNHFKLKHDVVLQIQPGGAHGAQWIAPEQVCVFLMNC